ncbi:hypothetical protein PPL_08705 [Heterostelium album PN500]|uniref:Uncharacterized protein n=1 Tax=Heterostelium pallidum (strain ATCC 26659 / Pp 5 / PN500) TaxID=670386 RepID=D3BJH9_HETP5|nr:hypothetical protein PPL_08705 [Heterostelium album PN500]EFA78059.1 hypothetical protein PPL_08705 [Heterostelium album PN500]|eukprot:XP_020430186.1 hypothetical protein PPL_08705 [Heterostelium album PN500]
MVSHADLSKSAVSEPATTTPTLQAPLTPQPSGFQQQQQQKQIGMQPMQPLQMQPMQPIPSMIGSGGNSNSSSGGGGGKEKNNNRWFPTNDNDPFLSIEQEKRKPQYKAVNWNDENKYAEIVSTLNSPSMVPQSAYMQQGMPVATNASDESDESDEPNESISDESNGSDEANQHARHANEPTANGSNAACYESYERNATVATD